MQPARPSRTALRVAIRRATHQILDTPPLLDDPIALRIIDAGSAATVRAKAHEDAFSTAARAFLAVRSRVAEDALAEAVRGGVRQYVVLGAGLDTFAYRNPFESLNLRVFEVDHPSTQAWKQQSLVDAAIDVPESLTFVPVDFERDTLAAGLERAGLDATQPAFFSWLGVAMYLTPEAIRATLGLVGALPRPSGVAFDYAVPRHSLSLLERLALDALSARVAVAGEPFVSFLSPSEVATILRVAGLRIVDDLGRDELNARYFAGRTDALAVRGQLGRIVVAEV